MYEHLTPWHNQLGLYDGLAHVLGSYALQVNLLALNVCTEYAVSHCEMMDHMVNGICTVLRKDNERFNEARFRTIIDAQRYLARPNATSQPCARTTLPNENVEER